MEGCGWRQISIPLVNIFLFLKFPVEMHCKTITTCQQLGTFDGWKVEKK